MIVAGIIAAVVAVIVGLVWISAGVEQYCDCDYFVPNRHDDKCAVCRREENPELYG